MKKIDAVLVVLNGKVLESVIEQINFAKINLGTIITSSREEKFFPVGKQQVPITSILRIERAIKNYNGYIWLIGDSSNDNDSLRKLKKFLTASNIANDKIFSLEEFSQQPSTWAANVRHVEKFGADFFATGNEYMRDGLNLEFIPCVHENKNFSRGGANLSDAKQNLRQSYFTAKHIFEHVKRGTVKFVLIGLTPESFLDDSSENFSHSQKLLNSTTPTRKADLNFNKIKKDLDRKFSLKKIVKWEDEIKFWDSDIVEENFQILKDYIELCHENDAEPVGVVFPLSPVAQKNYNKNFLKNFREIIRRAEESCDFFCVDMLDLNFTYSFFCDVTHLNAKGMMTANAFLALKLYEKKLLPAESFCDMTYDYFDGLSNFAPKDDYNALMEHVFESSVQLICHKDKVKLGFVLYDSSMWCGDDLYNLFVDNKRFEVTVFLCRRVVAGDEKYNIIQEGFLRGVEQLKSHGLNVVIVNSSYSKVEPQDVLIFLNPYLLRFPNPLKPTNITVKTLLAHIPYSFDIAVRSLGYYNRIIFRTAWRIFFSSVIGLDVYAKNNYVGLPRGVFSGYPRTDVFFDKNSDFRFDWKMAQPNAKKVIWAPHWSINGGVNYATFQWNFKFMYEFAKAHSEISWILKPHPNLFLSVLSEKIFPSPEAFKEYLQKWDDLPNAMVYTGGYYQAIFATSDGMIHDSGSFIAEYQFANKPMIFLTREGETFNDLGSEILKASYLVDGKDLDAIAQTMQKVFVEGNDYKAAERKKVFDNYLNYPKFNSLLASKFIYKSIADELKEASK